MVSFKSVGLFEMYILLLKIILLYPCIKFTHSCFKYFNCIMLLSMARSSVASLNMLQFELNSIVLTFDQTYHDSTRVLPIGWTKKMNLIRLEVSQLNHLSVQ